MIDIRQCRPGTKRREVFHDGELIRAVPIDVVRAAGVDDTSGLSPQDLMTALAEVEPACGHERALRLIGYRERSVHEIRTRLADDGYTPDVVDIVVDRLLGVGLLDDVRFAGTYTRTKRSAGWGRRRIARGLTSAGVDDATIDSTLAEDLPLNDELERAASIISRRPIVTRSDRERALRKLLTRGFDFDVAKRALSHANPESPQDDSERDDS